MAALLCERFRKLEQRRFRTERPRTEQAGTDRQAAKREKAMERETDLKKLSALMTVVT